MKHLHVVHAPRKPTPDTRVGLMNPAFRYTSAANTNIRATLERARRELAKEQK